jgi:hypothetical protein
VGENTGGGEGESERAVVGVGEPMLDCGGCTAGKGVGGGLNGGNISRGEFNLPHPPFGSPHF